MSEQNNAVELPTIHVTAEKIKLIDAYENSLYAQTDERQICCPVCLKTDCQIYKNNGIPFLSQRGWSVALGQFGKRPLKLTEAQKEQIILDYIAEHESDIEHMYLDSNGFLTVGIGKNIHRYSDDELAKLPFTINGRAATRDEILQEAKRVKNMPKNHNASYYKSDIRIQDKEFRRQSALDHIRQDRKALRNIFPEFDKYSVNLQKGLHDMIYTLGATRFKTKFNNFINGVRNWDFVTAANESLRKFNSKDTPAKSEKDKRNIDTKALFLKEALFLENLKKWMGKK